MATTVYYVINLEEKKFYFFLNYDQARAKSDSFGKVSCKFDSGSSQDLPKYMVETKTLKGFYGTVYLQANWHLDYTGKQNICSYQIMDHKPKETREGYTNEKFVLMPYDQWIHRNDPKPLPQEIKDHIAKADVTKMFHDKGDDGKIKHIYRSPS